MPRGLSRVQTLASRVMWLDRHRRTVAILAAGLITPLLMRPMSDTLGADWPRIHATALSAMLGIGVWCVVEILLVWITAMWETECARLIRDRGLPRAIVRK
jgi:hypothetical protein